MPRCSCKEYRNLNGFFAITMGLSNPAVCRLNMTWEVSRDETPKVTPHRVQVSLFFPQKLPSKFRKFYREFENLMASWTSAVCPPEHFLFCGQAAVWWLTVGVAVPTGPVQEPPSVPADGRQTGASHHSFHASADQRFRLGRRQDVLLLPKQPCCMNCFNFLPDMTFTQEGNKTFVDNLVNFEKMVRFRMYRLFWFFFLH